jgi:hypothetical protein
MVHIRPSPQGVSTLAIYCRRRSAANGESGYGGDVWHFYNSYRKTFRKNNKRRCNQHIGTSEFLIKKYRTHNFIKKNEVFDM